MKVPTYTENKYFIFTFSRFPHIIREFESTELYYPEDNLTACGSSFATKEDALDFAYKIECMKRDIQETEFIVKRSFSHLWIHNLFTNKKDDSIVPVVIDGVLCGLLN